LKCFNEPKNAYLVDNSYINEFKRNTVNMKNTSILSFTIFLTACFLWLNFQPQPTGQTQLTTNNDLPFFEKETKGWFKMKDNTQLAVQNLLDKHHTDLGLTQWDELENYRNNVDDLGMTHHRFQQYHKGILVENAELLIHEKDGFVQTFNGELVANLDLNASPTFTKETAIDLALDFLPAEKYIWEDDGAEAILQRIEKNTAATFYPNPELVWLKLDTPTDTYRLAYKMDIQAEKPLFRQIIYVDAIDETNLLEVEMIHAANVVGEAETKYSGTRSIVTDSITPNAYNLRETTRGDGVETYNLMGSTEFGDGVDFVDDDNIWNNVNDEQDEVATDAHWGAEMTFDYLQTVHNYTGVDGEGMAFINYVHYNEGVVNAFWNGSWASFGDGDNSRSPLTSLDVVAHEFAHGITAANARLIYRNESGALNESFSDIFGAAVEFWATPDAADWLIGEDFHIFGGEFRDMENPNSKGHPHTYLGDNWVTGSGDNGGVHSNSGVQNYWFYLLSEGGSGTNNNGENYEVEAIGIDTAAAIAFRNLRFYLTRNSNHFDAREGGLQSAEDLYGVCSYEVTQTGNAWYAVGLGNGFADNDLRLLEISNPVGVTCGLNAEEFPTLAFRYNGCLTPLESGLAIPISMQVDSGNIVQDTVILTEVIEAADTILFTFNKPINGLGIAGDHILRVWTALENDPYGQNDTLSVDIFNIIEQNTDFSGEDSPTPTPACFMTTKNIEMNMVFLGCDSIAAGTELAVYYSINDDAPTEEIHILSATLFTFDTITHVFATPADFTSNLGRNDLKAGVNLPGDFLNDNDETPFRIVTNPELMVEDDLLTFENGAISLDSIYFFPNEKAAIYPSPDAAATGMTGILMTGGNAPSLFETDEFTEPADSNVWMVNEQFNAQSCICVNATDMDMDMVTLSFDLKQTMSPIHLVAFGAISPYASPMRVLVNQEPISETFVPSTFTGDDFVNHSMNLNDWVGTSFEVCFETRNLVSAESDVTNKGDNAYLDNINISSDLVATKEILTQFKGMTTFPNPTSGAFSMTWESTNSGNLDVAVFDVFGKKVKQLRTQNRIGFNQLSLKLDPVDAGTYFVRMSDGEAAILQRVIVF
jgi:Zn-dependent metalloprotease